MPDLSVPLGDQWHGRGVGGILDVSVTITERGPVVVLAGEADVTCEKELNELLSGQLAGGTTQLTVDVSGLRFADAASIRTLILAARALEEREGSLVLVHPQRSVARVIALLGVEQVFTIVTGTPAPPDAPGGAAEPDS